MGRVMKVLLLGGTGLISGAVASELLRRRVEVAVVTRGRSSGRVEKGAEWIRCDRRDTDRLSRLLSGRSFDAVVDSTCYNARDAEETVALFRDRTEQIVVLSSVAAYKRPYRSLPTREEEEELWEEPEYGYALGKALMERALRRMSAEGVPITIVRPSLTFGTGARNVGVLRQNLGILARIGAGKPVVMFGDGTIPWSFCFAPDVARAIVELLGRPGAIGESFHVASQEPTLWRDLYLEFGRIAGREPVFVYLPSRTLYHALPELCAHLYFEKSYPGVFDDAKLLSVVPGFRMEITLAGGLRALVESWSSDGLGVDPERDLLEDRLVAAAKLGEEAVVAAGRGAFPQG